MPHKYQPNYVYLKFVQLSRVHLFTMIQILTMAVLWGIKSYNKTSIAFPVMLVVICVIRLKGWASFHFLDLWLVSCHWHRSLIGHYWLLNHLLYQEGHWMHFQSSRTPSSWRFAARKKKFQKKIRCQKSNFAKNRWKWW